MESAVTGRMLDAELTATLDIPAAVLDFWRPRREQGLIEWAQEHVRITEGPAVRSHGGSIPWNPDTFPLQRAPLESIEDPKWTRTILMTAPQAFGKTVIVAAMLLYAIHYRRVSCMYVAGSRELAATQWRKKFEPAMQADEPLAELFFENPDFGGTKDRRDFKNGTSWHMTGAESIGSLSGFTAPVGAFDDLQAYIESLVRFGHAADYGVSRTESFPADQISLLFAGTASTIEAWLWRSMLGSAFFCPFVPCLSCGTYQLIEFDRFEFDRDDPVAARDECWMRCANDCKGSDAGCVDGCRSRSGTDPRHGHDREMHNSENRGGGETQTGRKRDTDGNDIRDACTHRIIFDQLPEMLDRFVWASMPPDADWILSPPAGGVTIDLNTADIYPDTKRNTSAAGFWCNAYYWLLGKSWGDRAAEWIGIQGDPDRLKTHQQNEQARPWAEPEIDEEALTEDEIASHAVEGYVAGTVPSEADVVTVTVDVQSGYVYYLIRAWKKATGDSWLIELGTKQKPLRGRDETEAEKVRRRALLISKALDEVDELCRTGWDRVTMDGGIVGHIDQTLGLIDRGYEPDVVAGWQAARGRGVWKTIKGQKAGTRASLWPAKPSVDSRGRTFRYVDVNAGKHLVRRLLRVPSGEPGYWRMPILGIHSNTVRAYLRHLASERFNRTRAIPAWEKKRPGMANHFWDNEVYQVCAAVACGVKLPGIERPQRAAAGGYAPRTSNSARNWKIGR